MTAATVTKSPQHLLEQLVATAASGTGAGNAGAGAKQLITSIGATVAVPTITASGSANVGEGISSVDVTVTGVALGDLVLVCTPTAALPTNARLVGSYVSATDTVTICFSAAANTGVTGANKTFDIVVLDRT